MSLRVVALIAALICLTASPGFAQGSLSAGVKAGVNFSNLSFDPEEEDCCDSKTGLVAGLFTTLPLTDVISIQPEFLYSMKGAKADADGTDVNFNLNFFEIPVLARADFTTAGDVRPFVVIGPAIAFKVSAKVEADDEEEDLDEVVESMDFALAIGGGVQFGRGSLEARYTHGLRDIDKDEVDEAKTRVFSVLFGYRF